MNEEKFKALTERPFSRFTDTTITNQEDLKKELQIVKREGVAVDNGEMETGVRCIAAPITDSTGNVVAAVSVSGPYLRLSNVRVEELKPLVKETALEISKIIGYTPLKA